MNGNLEFYSCNKLYTFPCYAFHTVFWRAKIEKRNGT